MGTFDSSAFKDAPKPDDPSKQDIYFNGPGVDLDRKLDVDVPDRDRPRHRRSQHPWCAGGTAARGSEQRRGRRLSDQPAWLVRDSADNAGLQQLNIYPSSDPAEVVVAKCGHGG